MATLLNMFPLVRPRFISLRMEPTPLLPVTPSPRGTMNDPKVVLVRLRLSRRVAPKMPLIVRTMSVSVSTWFTCLSSPIPYSPTGPYSGTVRVSSPCSQAAMLAMALYPLASFCIYVFRVRCIVFHGTSPRGEGSRPPTSRPSMH